MLQFLRNLAPGRRKSRAKLKSLPGFDADFYARQNEDVRAAGLDPLTHFIEYGWREGRDPSPGFSLNDYLLANPDVDSSGVNPLVHYLEHGLREGRRLRPHVVPKQHLQPIESVAPSAESHSISRVSMFHRPEPDARAVVV